MAPVTGVFVKRLTMHAGFAISLWPVQLAFAVIICGKLCVLFHCEFFLYHCCFEYRRV